MEINYKVETYENGEWYSWQKCAAPLKNRRTLDESLDMGRFELFYIKRSEPFKPFTPVRFTAEQEDGTVLVHARVVVRDSVNQRVYADQGTPKYNHVVEIIESTKALEREVCDTITFTNSLGKNYTKSQRLMPFVQDSISPIFPDKAYHNQPASYVSPLLAGDKIIIDPASAGVRDSINREQTIKLDVTVTSSIGNEQKFTFDRNATTNIWNPSIAYADLNYLGSSAIKYEYIYATQAGGLASYGFHYDFYVTQNIAPKDPYTITSVLVRILSIYKTRRDGLEPQKYTLDPGIAERYRDIAAPEFYITKATLFEALLQVGGYIHAIPRLLPGNVVTFDELGGMDEVQIKGRLVARDIVWQEDQYCAEIDSHADNIINTTDTTQGSIIDPCYNGYKTVRCQEGSVEISDDTAIIALEYPAYSIEKVEMGYLPDETGLAGEITPFVYDSAEYGALSGYSDVYPDSKGYALEFVQGERGITQLNFKLPDAVSAALRDPALNKIVSAATGRNYTSAATTLSGKFKNLAFRVTYVPIASARIKQRKTMPDEFSGTLIYNQGANSVEAEAFGENLKGTIAKMGNKIDIRSYHIKDLNDLPKPGQVVDGMYIASVDEEYWPNYIKVTVTLTADYNRLADYIGINSNYRMFDVSERQSVDRYINYGEALVIGDETEAAEDTVLTAEGLKAFGSVFEQNTGAKPASYAIIEGKSGGVQAGAKIIHSCLSFAAGNSLVFEWKHNDNYSAGFKAAAYDTNDKNKNTQQYVPYGDPYGELDTVGVEIGYFTAPVVNSYGQQSDLNGFANLFPQHTGTDYPRRVYLDTGSHPYLVRKDSRENIISAYQLHLEQNRKDIVIGTGLMQNNPLVRYGDDKTAARLAAKFVWLPRKLNKFEKTVNLSGAVEDARSGYVTFSPGGKSFSIGPWANTHTQTFKAWAFVDGEGYLLIGENGDIAPGESTKIMKFTSKRIEI